MNPHQPGPGVVRLLDTPFCMIEWDEPRSLARFVRKAQPYFTVADIAREGLVVDRVLERAGRTRILIDLRAVTPRDEPAFEAAITKFWRRVLRGAERLGIVVQTAVGALQVKRYMGPEGSLAVMFTRHEEALAFFDAPSPALAPVPAEPPASPALAWRDRGPFGSL